MLLWRELAETAKNEHKRKEKVLSSCYQEYIRTLSKAVLSIK